jgi:hypothetical protein
MLVVRTCGACSGFEWLLLLITVSCSERLPPAVLDFSKGVVHGVGILCLLLVVVILLLLILIVLLLLVVCMICFRYDSRLLHLVVVW